MNIPLVMYNTFIFTTMRCVISHHMMGDITQIVTGNQDQDCPRIQWGRSKSQLLKGLEEMCGKFHQWLHSAQ